MRFGLKSSILAVAILSLAACGGAKDSNSEQAAAPSEQAAAPPEPFSNCVAQVNASAGQNANIAAGECVVSPSGSYILKFGIDGNIILAQKSGDQQTQVWHSDSGGATGGRAFALQADGNLVMVEGDKVMWNTESNGKEGSYRLTVSDDGKVSIAKVDADSAALKTVWTKP